jgi:hypothetical protein
MSPRQSVLPSNWDRARALEAAAAATAAQFETAHP